MQIDLSTLINTEICQNPRQITNLFEGLASFVCGFTGNHKNSAQDSTEFLSRNFQRFSVFHCTGPDFHRIPAENSK